ncbi:MAG: MarR family transcriptional regulator [Clostridia bacterium]|nr:MarR family transcriptional regulator [Clostridia bacterium]
MLEKIFEEIYFYFDEELVRRAETLFYMQDMSKISINHIEYLEVIQNMEKPTLSDIAMELTFSKPSVTFMVNKLIEQGLVKKVRSEADKRVFYVELTELGKLLIEIQLNIYRDFAKNLEKILGNEEVEILAGLLNKGLRAVKGK